MNSRILSNPLWSSSNLIVFSCNFSISFRIFSYSLCFFRILQNSLQFSRNFVGFSHLFSVLFGFFRIGAESLRFSEILLDFLKFLWYFLIPPNSLTFSQVHLDSFEFSHILTVSFGFIRIFSDPLGIWPRFLVISRILSVSSGFYLILSEFGRIPPYFFGFFSACFMFFRILFNYFRILSNSRGFFQLFRDSPKYRNMWI